MAGEARRQELDVLRERAQLAHVLAQVDFRKPGGQNGVRAGIVFAHQTGFVTRAAKPELYPANPSE